MKYEFKCTNKQCRKHDTTVTIRCKHEDLTKHINCIICKDEMSRVWSAPSIKTGDGVK